MGIMSSLDPPLIKAVKNESLNEVTRLIDEGTNINVKDERGNTAFYASGYGFLEILKVLHQHGASIDDAGEKKFTPLHYACQEGHLPVVSYLLDAGVHIDPENSEGATPLHKAAQKGQFSVLKYLLQHGANFDHVSKAKGYSTLTSAAISGHLDMIMYVVKKSGSINSKDINGRSAVHQLSQFGHLQSLKCMVQQGLNLHDKSDVGSTALHFACSGTGDVETVQYLIGKGVDLHCKDKWGETALHDAASNGHLSAARIVVDNGANVNDLSNDGETPIMCAAANGRIAIVEWLLGIKARCDTISKDGKTAINLAVTNNHKDITELLFKHTLCCKCVERSSADTIQYFLQVDPHCDNKFWKTSLHLSASEGLLQAVEIMLEKGASINELDNNGESPIMIASKKGHVALVELLLGKNAKCDIISKDGKTVIDLASENDHTNIVELILKNRFFFMEGKDDTKINWNDIEKLTLVRNCSTKVITLGEVCSGKSSLIRTLISNEQYQTSTSDRTIVADHRQWKVNENQCFSIVDLGGHDSYKSTSVFFSTNTPRSIFLLCRSALSQDYKLAFLWFREALTRAPKCLLIPVLTKIDLLPPDQHIDDILESFSGNIADYIEREIEAFEIKKINMCESAQKEQAKELIQRYAHLKTELQSLICVASTSEGYEDTIEIIKSKIISWSERTENQIMVPQAYHVFYSKIGSLGLRNASQGAEAASSTSNHKLEDEVEKLSEAKSPDTTLNLKEEMAMFSGATASMPTFCLGDQEAVISEASSSKITVREGSATKFSKQFSNFFAKFPKPFKSKNKEKHKPRESKNKEKHKPRETSQEEIEADTEIQYEPLPEKEYSKQIANEPNQNKKDYIEVSNRSLTQKQTYDQLQYLMLNDAKRVFEDVQRGLGESHSSDEDFRCCLQHLHNLGLLLWFNGSEKLESIVFNNLKSFVSILQTVFHHATDHMLSFDKMNKQQRLIFEGKKQLFASHIELFKEHGLMQKTILNTLLIENQCDIDVSFLMELIQKLGVGFRMCHEHDDVLFIPFYLERKPINDFILDKIRNMDVCSDNEVSMECKIGGNMPRSFYNYVLVQIFDHLYKHRAIQEREMWSNGIYAMIGTTYLLMLYEDNELDETINLKLKGPADDLPVMWKYIKFLYDITKNTKLEWWTGVMLAAIFICCHCKIILRELQKSLAVSEADKCFVPYEWNLEEILQMPEDELVTIAMCKGTKEKIPAGFVQPFNQGHECASKMISDVKEYMNTHKVGQEERSDMAGNSTTHTMQENDNNEPTNEGNASGVNSPPVLMDEVTLAIKEACDMTEHNTIDAVQELDSNGKANDNNASDVIVSSVLIEEDVTPKEECEMAEHSTKNAVQEMDSNVKANENNASHMNAPSVLKEEEDVTQKEESDMAEHSTTYTVQEMDSNEKTNETNEPDVNAPLVLIEEGAVGPKKLEHAYDRYFSYEVAKSGCAQIAMDSCSTLTLSSIKNQAKERSSEIAISKLERKMDRGLAILSQQMYGYNKLLFTQIQTQGEQVSSKITSQIEESEIELKQKMTLTTGDAGAADITHKHPLFQKHQDYIYEHLHPSEDLVQNLFGIGLLKQDDVSIINAEKRDLGKTKRILLYTDDQFDEGVKMLIEGLVCDNNAKNRSIGKMLSEEFENKLSD